MKLLCLSFFLFSVLSASVVNAFAVDREAFTFTDYDLNVRIEPDQQRLGVRGKIKLRNDSPTPQKVAVLQISSSLDWRSITAGGKQLQFVSQLYTSDIDHTGALSEAIVSLPDGIAPKGSIELEIGYEGVIVLDATRLTRIGAPEDVARASDWDQIGPKFTAVRGAGYVAWYPIATEAEDLTDTDNSFGPLGRWKQREAASHVHLHFNLNISQDAAERASETIVNPVSCHVAADKALAEKASLQTSNTDCNYLPLGFLLPTFVVASYDLLQRPGMEIRYLLGHDASASSYADACAKILPLVAEWFGAARDNAQTAELSQPDAASFVSGSLLLTPLSSMDLKVAGLLATYQLTHAAFSSPRQWINEGVAHFAQALYLEQQSGRQAAVKYMETHSAALTAFEKQTVAKNTVARNEDEAARSLVNTNDEELYRSKAMYVWWMLRDMLGEPALKKAFASYQPDRDKEPSYMQRLVQAQTQRDLEWFFDDWVYRDRGLPDFKVASAFTRKTLPEGFMVTITVENQGGTGAEVPVTVKFSGGEISKRIVVRGKSSGVIRVEVPKAPEEIVINDGSVPESDITNNSFKIENSDANTKGSGER